MVIKILMQKDEEHILKLMYDEMSVLFVLLEYW